MPMETSNKILNSRKHKLLNPKAENRCCRMTVSKNRFITHICRTRSSKKTPKKLDNIVKIYQIGSWLHLMYRLLIKQVLLKIL